MRFARIRLLGGSVGYSGIGQKYTIGNKPPLEKMRDMLRLSENEYDSLARLKHIDTIAAKCVMKIEELERIK